MPTLIFKRIFDFTVALLALLLLSPVLLIATVGIAVTSRGPILFRAERAGCGGVPFTMYKFRTMHVQREEGASRITAARDTRIFWWGKVLRTTKIDELPQLLNVVLGQMSIVGPRPEDMSIVNEHYAPWMMETLGVRPGMASPGSIYGSMYDYERDAKGVVIDDPEADYLENLLPMKLAIELVYVRQHSILYDIRVIVRTLLLIVRVIAGTRSFPPPPEHRDAQDILEAPSEYTNAVR